MNYINDEMYNLHKVEVVCHADKESVGDVIGKSHRETRRYSGQASDEVAHDEHWKPTNPIRLHLSRL